MTSSTVDPKVLWLRTLAWEQAATRSEATAQTLLRPAAANRHRVSAVVSGSTSGCPLEAEIRATFPDDADWAVKVAMRESRCTAGAVNWREGCDTSGRTVSHAEGVFQLCWPLHAALAASVGCSDPLDADCNLRMARRLYDEEGRAPWGG